MKRAALVVATSVALLLSGVSVSAHATTRKYVSMPSDGQVIGSGRGSSVSGDLLNIPGNPIEGEYIPSSYGGGSKGTKLPVQPQYQYVKSRTIKGMVGNLRGGVVGAGLTIGLSWMLEQVGGFIDENGQAMKPGGSTVDGIPASPTSYSLPSQVCVNLPYSQTFSKVVTVTNSQGQVFAVTVANNPVSETPPFLPSTYTFVNNCTSKALGYNAVNGYYPVAGARLLSDPATDIVNGAPVPLTEADYDLIEAAANAKDSEWLKERLREHCEGSLKPQACFESLRNSTSLSGPSTVTEPGPTTTTAGPSGTTTSTTNTKIDITYGDNYYDYRQTKTTITTKPDGSTETKTETEPEKDEPTEQETEDMPALGDPYSPYINKLNEIKADVAAPPSVVPSIGYSSWYSFGGGCSELTFELPIYGSFTTNYCPYIYDWVRPILAFLFAVFTWHYCRSLWSEAVTQARPI